MSLNAHSPSLGQMATSIFFRLPSELRNQIYEQFVVNEKIQRDTVASDPDSCSSDASSTTSFESIAEKFKRQRRPLCPPSITHVCKKMREEALSMYYAENIFYLPQAIYSADRCKHVAIWAQGRYELDVITKSKSH